MKGNQMENNTHVVLHLLTNMFHFSLLVLHGIYHYVGIQLAVFEATPFGGCLKGKQKDNYARVVLHLLTTMLRFSLLVLHGMYHYVDIRLAIF